MAEGTIRELLEKIERAKQEWESTADSLPDLICLVDDRGRIIRANRTVETWNLGRVVDAPGRRVHELLHPGCTDPGCYLESFWRRASRRSLQHQLDQCEVYDERLQRYLLIRTHPCRHERRTKATGSTVLIVSDITGRVQAEEAQRELLRLKEEFLARVSHELRTPLFAIQGFVNLLLRDKVRDPTIQREFLNRIAEQTGRLTTLVENLLDVSELERGALTLRKTQVKIQEIAQRVVQEMGDIAQERAIAIMARVPPLPIIMADPDRIEQVLVHLIGNALKFTPRGGQVVVVGYMAKGAVVVQVRDTGIGIPPEAMPYLFSKFYQVDGSSTRRAGGTGLGLYLCKLIVEAHGGEIWAESKPNRGSTFNFTLPLMANN